MEKEQKYIDYLKLTAASTKNKEVKSFNFIIPKNKVFDNRMILGKKYKVTVESLEQ